MFRFVRSPVTRAYDHTDTLTLLGNDGSVRRLIGDSAALVRVLLSYTTSPRSQEDILAHLAQLTGQQVSLTGVIQDALTLLEEVGAIKKVSATADDITPPRKRSRQRRLVLALSGAIGSMVAPSLVELLLARGFEVRVAATKNALRFVSVLTLEALTHHHVMSSLWPKSPSSPVPHLELSRWADIVVIFPASATTLSRIAQGNCATLVSALAISTRAPVLLVPSMNESMLGSPSVQRNLDQLRADGFFVTHPSTGFEVADAPAHRQPMPSTAPPVSVLVDLISALVDHDLPTQSPSPSAISSDEPWEGLYRQLERHADLPWFTESLDDDITDILDHQRNCPPCQMLDLGTGLGTAAIHAANRGFMVVATDISPRALQLARTRAGALPIVWLVDNVLSSHLQGTFDLVLDRGCLHVLPEQHQSLYATSVARLMRPKGCLVIKCHSTAEPSDMGTFKFTVEQLADLLKAHFQLIHAQPSTMPGPSGHAPRALLCQFKRHSDQTSS